MKLRKSKTDKGYSLTFEISSQEAQRAELFLTWHSSNINDYIEALQQIQGIPRKPNPNIADMFKAKFGKNFEDFVPFQYEPLDQRAYAHRQQHAYQNFTRQPKPTPEPSWVKVLGLKRTATKDEIKAKYRELAKKNHPDKGGDALEFAAITAAYDEAMGK